MRNLVLYLMFSVFTISCSSKITIQEKDHYNIGPLKNNQKHGKWKYYFPDGIIFQKGHFKNDLKAGKWKMYHPNKVVRQLGIFKNGKMDGRWKFYHKNKMLYGMSNFKNGKFNGISKWYFNNGQIHTIRNYVDGKLISVDFANNRNGDSIDKGTIKNGNGTLIIYESETENDAIVEIINYENGAIKN